MDQRTLGRTGVHVSRALDAGIDFIDTADVYARGDSEEIVGKSLTDGRRDNVVLATKFHGTMGDDPDAAGNSRRWIFREVEASLKRPLDPGQPGEARGRRRARPAPPHAGAARVPTRRTGRDPRRHVARRIDAIVTPGTNVNPIDAGWTNPALAPAARRR